MRRLTSCVSVPLLFLAAGCGTTMTAVPLSAKAKADGVGNGIPYYLPRHYLIITYNFSHKGTVTTTTKTTKVEAAKADDAKKDEAKKDEGKKDEGKKDEAKKEGAATGKAGAGAGAAAGAEGGGAGGAGGATQTVEQVVTTPQILVPDFVKPQFLYEWVVLPDYEQKYGLQYERGTGTAEMNFELKDGWMLTGITSKTDAKTAETITAAGTAIGSIVSASLGNVAAAVAPPADDKTPKEVNAAFLNARLDTLKAELAKSDLTHGMWVYRLEDNGALRLIERWTSAEGDPHKARDVTAPLPDNAPDLNLPPPPKPR